MQTVTTWRCTLRGRRVLGADVEYPQTNHCLPGPELAKNEICRSSCDGVLRYMSPVFWLAGTANFVKHIPFDAPHSPTICKAYT